MQHIKTFLTFIWEILWPCLVVGLVASAFITGGFLIGIIYRLASAGFKFGAGF